MACPKILNFMHTSARVSYTKFFSEGANQLQSARLCSTRIENSSKPNFWAKTVQPS